MKVYRVVVVGSMACLAALVGITAFSGSAVHVLGESSASYTVDDVRDVVGNGRRYTQKYEQELLDKLWVSGASDTQMSLAESILNATVSKDIEQAMVFQSELDATVKRLADYMDNATSEGVLAVLREVEVRKGTVDTAVAKTGVTPGDYDELVAEIAQYTADRETDVVVGDIGSSMMVFNGEFNIFQAYSSENGYLGMQNVTSFTQEVTAQFNGVVTEVGYDSIEITCNSQMKFGYNGISGVIVEEGVKVEQYDKVAELRPTSKCTFWVELDGERIDPMLLFGDIGRMEMNRWARSNPGLTAEGFEDGKYIGGKNAPEPEDIIIKGGDAIEGVFID